MKHKSSRKWIVLTIKGILIALIVYYLLAGIEWSHLEKAVLEYGVGTLSIGVALIVANDIVQAARWRFLTRRMCSLQGSFESIVVGGFLNMILPAKMGEVSRLVYLRNVYGYPINYGVGAMVVERGADLFMVACFLAIGAGVATGNSALQWGAVATVSAMVGTVFAIKRDKGKNFMRWLGKLPFRFIRIYSRKIVRLIVRDIGGDRIVQVLLYTTALRGVYFMTVGFFLNGVASLDLSVAQMFVVYLVSSIAFAIPLAPGGAGTFHAGMVMAMGWYGVGKEEALAIAIVFHLLLNLVPVSVALGIVLFKDIPLSSMVRMDGRKHKTTASALAETHEVKQ